MQLEALEKVLDSEVKVLQNEVDEIATESMNAEIDVQRAEDQVSQMELSSYQESKEFLQMLSQGHEHGWDNIRNWIGWETWDWEPNYY